ncbi:MAG: hypothetical protein LH605_10450 [Microbacteriaceae bacterium]|nr:hypothetical protein [Microbacteriaceae bacterium]
MTAISTLRKRMRPRSRLGWWSVGLAGLVLFVAPIASLGTGLAIRLFESSYVVSTSDAVFLTIPCVVASAALGIAAILLRRDRSPVVVLVTAAMTAIMVFLWAEEFLFRL